MSEVTDQKDQIVTVTRDLIPLYDSNAPYSDIAAQLATIQSEVTTLDGLQTPAVPATDASPATFAAVSPSRRQKEKIVVMVRDLLRRANVTASPVSDNKDALDFNVRQQIGNVKRDIEYLDQLTD